MPYVLIVEDDADTRTMLATLARTQQLSCDTAATLEEARTLVSTHPPISCCAISCCRTATDGSVRCVAEACAL